MTYISLNQTPRRTITELFGSNLMKQFLQWFAVEEGDCYKIDNLDMMKIEKRFF